MNRFDMIGYKLLRLVERYMMFVLAFWAYRYVHEKNVYVEPAIRTVPIRGKEWK